MVFGVDLGAQTTPWLLGGILGVLTALWVLRVNSKSLMNKSLALYIGLQGVLAFMIGLDNNTGPRAPPEAAIPVLTITSLLGAWAFWWIHRSWPLFTDNVMRRFQTLLLAGAIVAGFYLSNRHWWDDGPLRWAAGLLPLSQATIAFLFAQAYRRLPTGPQRRSLLLLCAAFGLPALYFGTGSLLLAIDGEVTGLHARIAWSLLVSSAVPGLATLGLLAMMWWKPRDGDMRPELGPVLYVAMLPVLGVLSLFVVRLGDGDATAAHAMFTGLWIAPHLILLAFATTRLQVVDMAEKLRRVIKSAVMAAIFLVILFSVSEGLEGLIGARFGALAGLGAAALLTFALTPLQKMADRIADVAMPRTVPIHERSPEERATYYREQVRLAWEDGELGQKERNYLDGLQRTLQLSPSVVGPIEYEEAPDYARRKMRAPGTPARPTQPPAAGRRGPTTLMRAPPGGA